MPECCCYVVGAGGEVSVFGEQLHWELVWIEAFDSSSLPVSPSFLAFALSWSSLSNLPFSHSTGSKLSMHSLDSGFMSKALCPQHFLDTTDLNWVLAIWKKKFLTCYLLQFFSCGGGAQVSAKELSAMHRTLGASERPWYTRSQVFFSPLYQIAISSNKWNMHKQSDGMESQAILHHI